jgi:hypothetical protein
VAVVLGLDHGDGDVGLVVEDIIGPLGLAAGGELAVDDDAALSEGDFLADLGVQIPAGGGERRGDVLGADIALAEKSLVHHLPDAICCADSKTGYDTRQLYPPGCTGGNLRRFP